MNSVWTDHYQRPLLTVCLYPRGAEGWEKLQQRPLITNLPLCVKFGTKLMGIRIYPGEILEYFEPTVIFTGLILITGSTPLENLTDQTFTSGVNPQAATNFPQGEILAKYVVI